MTDKHLTESAWKIFAKGADYKDAPLLKALAALAKAQREGPQAVLDALDDLDKQLKTLRSANKGNKELASYLDRVEKASDAQRKDSEKELEAAQASDEEEEEEESPALLTSKLVPLIKQVRKGDVVLKAMIVTTGKETAVLLSRRSIAPTRSKLLKEYLGATGGAKVISGDCMLEENTITFVVQSQAAGLAKKLKAALLAQTELRLKVRVRGEDPNDLDEEGEDGGEGEADREEQPRADAIPDAPPPPDELQMRFTARLAKLEPLIAAALRAQRGDVAKIRAVADFAREKGHGGQAAAGLKALDTVEQLLRAAASAPGSPTAGSQEPGGENPVDPGMAFQARLAALLPKVKDFIASGGERGQEVKLKVSEAGVFARKREFERAHDLLDDAEQAMTQSASGNQSQDAKAAEARRLLRQTQSQLEAASRASLDDEQSQLLQKLRTAVELAREAHDAANHERALLILNRLLAGGQLQALAEQTATHEDAEPDEDNTPTEGDADDEPQAVDRVGILRQRMFLLEGWKRIPGRLRSSLAELRKTLVDMGQDADEDPAELMDAVSDELEEMLGEIQDQIDDAINAGDGSAFKGLRSRAESDPLLKHLASDPSGASAGLLNEIVTALDEIENGMSAA